MYVYKTYTLFSRIGGSEHEDQEHRMPEGNILQHWFNQSIKRTRGPEY